MYLVKTPFWLRWLYPGLVWHKERSQKLIYLTFDDGPIPVVTPFVLKTLKAFNAKATFFCIGDNVQKHPDIYEQVLADGHRVGNHTFNHLKGWDTLDTEYLENVAKCAELVNSNLFRPPYGRAKKSQYSILNTRYSSVMWDVLSGDFDTSLKPEKCLKNVTRHTENGSIVVFHDSVKAFERLEYTLPRALEAWRTEGFQFGIL
ncbi:MAG: polysaccharide deacetylase [Sphingobacteriaceae bacterium]|jgi:peptidoglycan/xylan/chitin deacetylase (PgdA/CDA1 family)|nr:polysaccharide deacetylase [Sphingobacteriaceae bacterium]